MTSIKHLRTTPEHYAGILLFVATRFLLILAQRVLLQLGTFDPEREERFQRISKSNLDK